MIFSGGQDSTICLHWAQSKFSKVFAIFFNYGQRHAIELKSAKKISKMNNVPLKIMRLNMFKELGGNSLTDKNLKIKTSRNKLPNTFVPGRNLIFITCAAAYAYKLGITDLVTGVCQTDYSGYPDCRKSTINSLRKSISLGMDSMFTIHTPLMAITKAQSVKLALKYQAMESLAYSHTCYEGLFPPCGKCPSCILREKGFKSAGIADPIWGRIQKQS